MYHSTDSSSELVNYPKTVVTIKLFVPIEQESLKSILKSETESRKRPMHHTILCCMQFKVVLKAKTKKVYLGGFVREDLVQLYFFIVGLCPDTPGFR